MALVMLTLTACGKSEEAMEKPAEANTAMESESMMVVDFEDGTYELVADQSEMLWVGKKVGGSHNGTVQITSGSVTQADGLWSNANFVIDMTTIVNNDLEGDSAKGLEDHLKGEDFFNVAEYPEAKFESTEIKAMDDGAWMVMGNLTIKGITNPVEFIANVNEAENGSLHATSEFKIDRTLWDVQFRSGKFFTDLGDKAISDEMSFELDLTFQKAEATSESMTDTDQ